MKKIYALLALCFLFSTLHAQVNLPHTLIFTEDDAAAWSDGIAQDGDGGSQNINGLDIEIFTATSAFAFASGSTIMWKENDYFFPVTRGIPPSHPAPILTLRIMALRP